MDIYIDILKIIINKVIFKKNIGLDIKNFCLKNGLVYIKLGQILATQNLGNIFTESDRKMLSSICDNCKIISYEEIIKLLKNEYGDNLFEIFEYIDSSPIGSASISQVHKALLKNGEEVAIKVKRLDVTNKVESDILKLKRMINKLGKLFKFTNLKGVDKAIDLYLDWILKETDFKSEIENIKIYSKYVNKVNGKVKNVKRLIVPRVYEEYSTDNVIVMEYIKYNTINNIVLNNKNKSIIVEALNSYIKLNFWAMFNNESIVFHGDPHSANLSIDDTGNLYFLDMGLIFALNNNEASLCRDFFLSIYSKNYQKLYNMLIIYGNLNDKEKKKFKNDLKKYVSDVKNKNVTHYFIDLIGVCIRYEFVPPDFLFNMAKAFICIYGICNYTKNDICADDLLKEQVIIYIFKKNINSLKNIFVSSTSILKKYKIHNFSDLISNLFCDTNFKDSLILSMDNAEELFYLINR